MDENDLSKKRNLVKEKIKEYIEEYYKRAQNPSFKTKEKNMYKFKNIEDIIKRLRIQDEIYVSKSTVQLALSELKNTIVKRDGVYGYTEEALRANANFPILNFANSIEIYNLKRRDMCFFRISPNLAIEVADYLNAVIGENMIYSFPVGDVIICIEIGHDTDVPGMFVDHTEELEPHVLRILTEGGFKIISYSYIETAGAIDNEETDDSEETDELDESEFETIDDEFETNNEDSSFMKTFYNKVFDELEYLVKKYVKEYMDVNFKNKAD